MSQIWSIFKQMFENTIHFQTNFEKYPSSGRGSVLGAPLEAAPRVFFEIRLKIDRILKHMFENEPYLGHPIFKIAIGLVCKMSPFSRGRKLPAKG